MKDERRAAVYAAEQQLRDLLSRSSGGTVDFFGSQLPVPVERRFSSFAELADYLKDVLARSSWSELAAPALRPRRGAALAHYEYEAACIAIPEAEQWAWRELVLLHELAHHIVALRTADRAAAHGPQFAGVYVELINQELGGTAALLLRAAFDGVGVEVGELP